MTKQEFDDLMVRMYNQYKLNRETIKITFIDYDLLLDQVGYRVNFLDKSTIIISDKLHFGEEFENIIDDYFILETKDKIINFIHKFVFTA